MLMLQGSYGVDWGEPITDSDDCEQVNIPVVNTQSTTTEAGSSVARGELWGLEPPSLFVKYSVYTLYYRL